MYAVVAEAARAANVRAPAFLLLSRSSLSKERRTRTATS